MKTKEIVELGKWKVGQEVLVSKRFGKTLATITRITTGRGGTIYVGNTAYDLNGFERGGDGWHTYFIEPCSQEDKEQFAKEVRRKKLVTFAFNKLDLDKASELVLKMRELGINI